MLAELHTETHYVKHNKLKIALIFSAVRYFAQLLRESGYQVHYFDYEQLICTEPREFRVLNEMQSWFQKLLNTT